MSWFIMEEKLSPNMNVIFNNSSFDQKQKYAAELIKKLLSNNFSEEEIPYVLDKIISKFK